MVWGIIGVAAFAAIGVRLAMLQGRPQVWWVSFTGSLLGIVLGSVLLVDESWVNQTLGVPNLAHLLSNLAFVLAGGSVTIYVHTLRHEHPVPAAMWLHGAVAGLVATVMTWAWVVAPLHETNYPRFREAPLPLAAVTYDLFFHLYFIPVLINVAACSIQLVGRTDRADPARRLGLLVIAGSSILDTAAHLLYLPRIGSWSAAADLITLVAVLGIASGSAAFLVVPQLLDLLRAWHLVGQLRPLWLRTRELHPSVALPSPRLIGRNPALQAERMIIEITDGLHLIRLPTAGVAATNDPFAAVAQALRHPSSGAADLAASTVLPVPMNRLEEEEQVLELARQYQAKADAS